VITASFFGVDALEPGDFVCRVTDAAGVVVVQKALAAVVGVYGVPYGMATQASSAGGAAIIALDGLHAEEIHELTGGPSKLRLNTTTGRAEKVASYVSGDIPVGNLNGQNYLALLPSAAAAAAVVSGIASVAGSGTTTVTGAGDKTVSNAAADQLSANQRGAFTTLVDADAALTLAGGRRYVLPASTLTAPRRITLSTAGATTDDEIRIERKDKGAYPLQIKKGAAYTDTIAMLDRPGIATFRYDGSAWVLQGQQAAGQIRVFNVLDYGATGNELLNGNPNGQAERDAIQAAIDAAAVACRDDPYAGGAVVYFPRGYYNLDGASDCLVMRRTPRDRPITYRGEGSSASRIQNPSGDVFRVETLAENPEHNHGGYGTAFEDLYLTARYYCVLYDLGDYLTYGGDGPRPELHFTRCVFNKEYSGPMVRIRASSRSRFWDCNVDPSYYYQGNMWVEIIHGSAAFFGCQGGGQMLRIVKGGEITLVECRPEGSSLTPAIDLEDCIGVRIIGGSSEGHDEGDALVRFTRCDSILVDGFLASNPDRSYIRLRGSAAIPSVSVTFGLDDTWWGGQPSCTRTSGSWFADGVCYGSVVRFTGSASNPGPFTVKEMTHTKLVFESAVVNEGPVSVTGTASFYQLQTTTQPTVTFNAGAKTLVRSVGRWDDDGFAVGMVITRTNSVVVGNRGSNSGEPLTINAISGDGLTLTVNETPANETLVGAQVEANKFAAGFTLRGCRYFDIRRCPTVGAFRTAGDQTRYGVEVDEDCRDGTIHLSGPGAYPSSSPDILIDAAATNITGEYAGLDGSANPRTVYVGAHRFAAIRDEENILRLRYGAPLDATTLAGLSIARGTSNGFVGLWFDETTDGFYTSASADESTLGTYLDLYAKRYVGRSDDSTRLVAQFGRTVSIDFSSAAPLANLGDTTGISFSRNFGGGYNTFQSVGNLYFSPVTGWIQFEPTEYVQFNLANGKYHAIFVNGLERARCNTTGVSWFGSTPVAQQADTVALTGMVGTADNTIADVGASFNQTTLNNNFADLAAKCNALRTLLRNYGLMA
jgi:hypothetical protein